jgi:hypothetical protein
VLAYAFFQFLMFLIGMYLIGIIPAAGSHRPFLILWLVIGVVFLLLNLIMLQLVQNGAIFVPNAFCPHDDADDALCRRSFFMIINGIWKNASIKNRRKVFDVYLQASNCTSSEFSGMHPFWNPLPLDFSSSVLTPHPPLLLIPLWSSCEY